MFEQKVGGMNLSVRTALGARGIFPGALFPRVPNATILLGNPQVFQRRYLPLLRLRCSNTGCRSVAGRVCVKFSRSGHLGLFPFGRTPAITAMAEYRKIIRNSA
jgi:hypothetical protein